ncbi:MAG: RNA polymerase sigma-70 factor (ECF subfamily) [Planctomycetota bacterium]|jgi:RNA polymerase sigma-70 factor (ECF subfamily)
MNSPTPPQNPPEDPRTMRLVREARQGSSESFEELYASIAPALHTWADLRIRPGQRSLIEPQDLVQEVWFRALRALEDFDPERIPFRLWIFRVAKNVLLEAFRKQRGSSVGIGPTTKMRAIHSLPDSVTAVSKRLMRDESLSIFAEEVRGLPEEEQKLVLHCGLEGLPYKEVAERLRITSDAVAKRWQRLRSKLNNGSLPAMLLNQD